MKICVAQVRPIKGDIEKNITNHSRWIERAVSIRCDLIVFPELSLTSYESKLADELAINIDDSRLDVFQATSDTSNITICVGIPVKNEKGVLISMVIFQPNMGRSAYSKQHLHIDELPYFVQGHEQVIFAVDKKRIAPAICYESTLPEHSERVFKIGADVYMASVADSTTGVVKAAKHYVEIAKKYSAIVVMANCLGPCDDFESSGKSSIWNENGSLLSQLNDFEEGIIVYDTISKEVTELV